MTTELHGKQTEDYQQYRKYRRAYRHLEPSQRPHRECGGCPMRTDCPLRYRIRPCIFRTIALAREAKRHEP